MHHRSLLTALLLLCFCSAYAQNATYLDVVRAKAAFTSSHYAPVAVTSSPDFDIEVLSTVRKYQLYDINTESLTSLRQHESGVVTLDLNLNNRTYQLDLVEVDLLSPSFKVVDARDRPVMVQTGKYFHGIVNGHPESMTAISVFDQEIMGVFSLPGEGNFIIGKVNDQTQQHILYAEEDLIAEYPYQCHAESQTAESFIPRQTASAITGEPCKKISIYIEVDNIMYRDRNRNMSNITNYVTGLFNVAAVLYGNEDVNIGIKTIKIWDTTDPYRKDKAKSCLDDFSNHIKNNIDGDIGHLLTTSNNNLGGIAWLNVLCRSYSGNNYNRTAISNISNTYRQYPQYSWSVLVITHEMGHNLGSPHTHACAWGPSGNEALDNCYDTEGGCGPGPRPSGGGTIMSYCHLSGVGINFSNGFGKEPGDLIRWRIQNAACLGGAFEAKNENQGLDAFYEGDSTILIADPRGAAYTYQWFRDDLPIPGGTDAELIVKTSGSYFCEVSTTCSEVTNTIDIMVNKFFISLHCGPQMPETGEEIIVLDTFFVDVPPQQQLIQVSGDLFDAVPPDAASSEIELGFCAGNYGISFLSQLNFFYTPPPASGITNKEFRRHKTVIFGSRCYDETLGDFDPTGEWIFDMFDDGNNVPDGPECWVQLEIRQKWAMDPLPSNCNLYLCAGDTAELDAGYDGLNYKWSTGDTTRRIMVFQPGNYSVTVTNGNVVKSDDIDVIIQPVEYHIDTTVCTGETVMLGNRILSVAGTYEESLVSSVGCDSNVTINLHIIDPPLLSDTVSLCFGATYNNKVYTKDTIIETTHDIGASCDSIYRLIVEVNKELDLQFIVDMGCEDQGATVRALGSGGASGQYRYDWSDGQQGEVISGVKSGTLTCELSDALDCKISKDIEVQNFDSVAVSHTQTDIICFGDSTGAIDISINKGRAPFTINWSNGATTEDIDHLTAGSYQLKVTDSNRCSEEVVVTLNQNDEILANETITNPSVNQNDGKIELSPTGGVGNYNFEWQDGPTSPNRTNLGSGKYIVTIRDSLGCEKVFEFDLKMNTSLDDIDGIDSHTIYPNPIADDLYIDLDLNQNHDVQLEIFDLFGRSVYQKSEHQVREIRQVVDMSGLPSGQYFLKVEIENRWGIVKLALH